MLHACRVGPLTLLSLLCISLCLLGETVRQGDTKVGEGNAT